MFATSCVVVTASAVSNVVAPSQDDKNNDVEVRLSCFVMVHVSPLGKLRTHFGSCQIDRMLISANEVLGF